MAAYVRYRDVSAKGPDIFRDPIAGSLSSILLQMTALALLSSFITQRSVGIVVWRRLPFVVWIVFAIYGDSFLFVFVTAILQHGIGVNLNLDICNAAITICLLCYVTTKLFIYLFLVEKAYIIRAGLKTRLQSKLYLLNAFGMTTVYIAVAIWNFVARIARIDSGQCFIGLGRTAMLPLIIYDAIVNLYLTCLFMIPLKKLYAFNNAQQTPAARKLRTVATRTFIGSVLTTLSSLVNFVVLMLMNGEPGWLCLVCCNADILFGAVVIQWATSKDNAGSNDRTTAAANYGADRSYINHSRAQTNSQNGTRHRPPTLDTGFGTGSNGIHLRVPPGPVSPPVRRSSIKPILKDVAEMGELQTPSSAGTSLHDSAIGTMKDATANMNLPSITTTTRELDEMSLDSILRQRSQEEFSASQIELTAPPPVQQESGDEERKRANVSFEKSA